MTKADRERVWLTSRELAARWHCAMGTLANWRYQGCGPHFSKQGRTGAHGVRILYDLADVVRWEKDHMMSSTVEAA
ncbi:hypothetical protein OZX67_03980 [Bifidobacterium sp. ESL0728]|uniref:hypothetical protein n=1 Tax=Bifidobacterium sp. ESL0728 TaxID=2983220 RepID=UPI0023F6EE8B|nr:hypothetical protein [Bifidobacterium sp. ESL0728]WEV59706.1 hypothetical protein OZX67_03980 [Bifidobacterium sp. ESL0728]